MIVGIVSKIIITVPMINSFYRMGYNLLYGDIISTIISILISVIINYIYIKTNNKKEKTLLQKRCANKKLYPNTWDIAVGGHISAGEDALLSAKRELEEELGLNSDDYEIKYNNMLVDTSVLAGILYRKK